MRGSDRVRTVDGWRFLPPDICGGPVRTGDEGSDRVLSIPPTNILERPDPDCGATTVLILFTYGSRRRRFFLGVCVRRTEPKFWRVCR